MKFYNKNGDLTAYSFSCGNVQEVKRNGKRKSIEMEHSHYHVKSGQIDGPNEIWETFTANELTKARKLFRSIKI